MLLVADFEAGAASAVMESPLAADQAAEVQPDGRVRIRARVVDSRSLRAWLMGFGPAVEVIEPPALRRQVAGDVEKMWARYRDRAEADD